MTLLAAAEMAVGSSARARIEPRRQCSHARRHLDSQVQLSPRMGSECPQADNVRETKKPLQAETFGLPRARRDQD